jgi:ribosomal protein L24E
MWKLTLAGYSKEVTMDLSLQVVQSVLTSALQSVDELCVVKPLYCSRWMDGWMGGMYVQSNGRTFWAHEWKKSVSWHLQPHPSSMVHWWVFTAAGSLWPFPYEYFHIHHFMALNPKTLNPKHPAVCKKLLEWYGIWFSHY